MKTVVIGTGRLASNLIPALQRAGHEVVNVNSRTLSDLPLEADVYIISVKDSALQEVIQRATKDRQHQLFVHTAGSMPLSVFAGHSDRYGVFYPMQTFSKDRVLDFSEIPLFLESSDAASLRVMRTLAESVTHHVYELSTADRKYLHLAAVFACNFVNHCYALSAEVLQRKGLPFSVMLPLIDETALKVHSMSPRQAQTGPAVRYDENVIQMQADLLQDTPLMQDLYQKMSLSIHQLATEQ